MEMISTSGTNDSGDDGTPQVPMVPGSSEPLLARIDAVLMDTTASTVPFKRAYGRLRDRDWIHNNRWLYRQPVAVQRSVVLRLTRLHLTLKHVEPDILVRAVIHCMVSSVDAPDALDTAPDCFDLSTKVYVMLLDTVAQPDMSDNAIMRVVEMIVTNVVRRLTCSAVYFPHAHIAAMYDKLYILLVHASTPTGSARFRVLVHALAQSVRPLRGLALPPGPMARLRGLLRLHRQQVVALFRTLVCRGHFEDADTLYASNRQGVRGSVVHWLGCLDDGDVTEVWTRCPETVAYCKAHATRLHSTLPPGPVASRCRTLLQPSEQHVLTGDATAYDLCALVCAEPKGIRIALERYPAVTQRGLVAGLLAVVTASNDSDGDGNASSVTADQVANVLKFCRDHPAYVLARMRGVPSTSEGTGFAQTVGFYARYLQWDAARLFATQKFRDLTRNRLDAWLERTPVSLRVMIPWMEEVRDRLAQLHPTNDHHFSHFSLPMSKWLTRSEDCLGRFLCHSFADVRDTVSVQALVTLLGKMIHAHLGMFRYTSFRCLRHFVRCVLVLRHVLDQPAVATADPCVLCDGAVAGCQHVLECGHVFHPECILQVAQFTTPAQYVSPYLMRCPYCTAEVMPKAATFEHAHTTNTPAHELALLYYVYP